MNPRDPFHPTPNQNDQTPSWSPRPGSSWQPSSGWERATIASPATAPAARTSPPSAPAPPSVAPRGRRTYGTVLGTALLAAILATGSTLAVVELSIPHGTGTTPAASANANVTAQNPSATAGTASVTQDDISGVVAQVKDSVLTLTSQIATTGGGNGRGFPFGGGLGGGTAVGIGSGIILTSDGYVLTNRHVVEGSESLKATLADGTEYPASVVKISDTQDLALVKVDATALKPATEASSQ